MMCETGYVMGPIGEGQPADDWMFSNFLWLLMLSLLVFGNSREPTEEAKEDKKDGQQPVPAESDK